uniref:Sushi domain-containing protein n=1 Tax=Anas platyrhynchos TaxID=8839 RepID=A0A8B9T508_ANAPL
MAGRSGENPFWDTLVDVPAAGQLTVLCGEPPAVANGRHNGTKGEFAQGSIVVYKCNHGFMLAGGSSIRCTARDEYHGVWSTPTPECRSDYLLCMSYCLVSSKSAARYIYRAGASVSFTCNPGYTLQGSPTSTCQADSRWSPPLPECKKGKCPSGCPPNIANGLHSGQSMDRFTQGAIVYYGCKDGFALVGNISINCSEAGQWSRPLPLCKAIGCERPEVRNGKVHKHPSTYEAGEILRFDCDAGHATDGAQEARCQPGGTWDPPVLACERGEFRPCPTPPKISNGDHDGHGKAEFTMGMFVTYSCDPGYYLTEDVSHVFCKASGNWSQPSPHCEGLSVHEVMCPRPPNIANGLHSGQSMDRFPQGTTVYYGCKDGFALVGNISINCSEAGQWSRPLPRCQGGSGHPQRCLQEQLQGSRHPGEILRFDCDAGHATEGPQRAQCQPGGSWDPPVLACERGVFTHLLALQPLRSPCASLSCSHGLAVTLLQSDQCPMPPKIRNGQHDGHGKTFFTTGMSVMYSCDPGYYLVGNAQVVCKTLGNWSQPMPRCEGASPSCGEATICIKPDVLNGQVVDGEGLIYGPGQTVTIQCQDGYSLQGTATILCQEDGSWEPPAPLCDLLHHQMLPIRTRALIGRSSRRCEISGGRVAWSGEIPTCQRIPCAPPPNIPHGKHTGRLLDEFHYGTSVTYSCEPGYPLQGEASIFCTTRDGMNGLEAARSCRAVLRPCASFPEARCPVPQIQNGRVVSAPSVTYTYKDTVTFECEPGYTMRGHSVVQCQLNSTWEPPVPACERGKCPSPPGIANGQHSGQPSDTFLVGSVVQYRCKDGYSLVENASLSCTAEGTWSRPLPRCEAIGCKRPEIEHGRTTGLEAVYKLEAIAVFECDFGYALKGSQESRCQFGGTWQPPVPTCEKSKCKQGGARTVAVFIPGTSVKYECDLGYVLTGKTTVSCLPSGTWSIPYPRCEGELRMPVRVSQQGSREAAGRGCTHRGANRRGFEGSEPTRSSLHGFSLNFNLIKTTGGSPGSGSCSPSPRFAALRFQLSPA